MQAHPLRLSPGDDLRGALEAALHRHEAHAAFVIQGIGSLSVAQLRFAGVDQPTELRGDLEILTLAGSVSPDGAHLHMSISDADGRVTGGHVARGCVVRTTAEILLALLPAYRFSREPDAGTGFNELVIRHDPS
ncbi:DNA-binding protein [Burkholderia cenocepacia]|uniref:PPC domain-containing DNA-binding protein n=1 Tax=Burkholderia cepacia complex TaxID=87882 RepID=UPI000F56C083|nr:MULTISPECIES: PPC domain-containing DNA-binding protein [Burkholderia cepacia complex]ELW9448157.1 DNA-binding protein [Burkholderia cenocepacia]MBR8482730.1 DNA-binding protein [Burkholderia cenocepacia]MDN7470572.1 DNA-binding protein [Burkholderia orbicola]MDN7502710.1 DNA-binding protein [Burkholderia orbicola]RQU22636.1 DNA-binding protein [Burkholderia cenocepacia]